MPTSPISSGSWHAIGHDPDTKQTTAAYLVPTKETQEQLAAAIRQSDYTILAIPGLIVLRCRWITWLYVHESLIEGS